MPLGLFLSAILILGTPGAAWCAGRTAVDVGAKAPAFKARNLVTGEPVDLDGQRGKLVVLTFWATWCSPCRHELTILERAQEILGKERLAVLAVNFAESDEALHELKRIAKPWQITLLEDRGRRIADRYGIQGIPHLFMISGDGTIVANHTGYGDKSVDELVSDINQALAQPSPRNQEPEA